MLKYTFNGRNSWTVSLRETVVGLITHCCTEDGSRLGFGAMQIVHDSYTHLGVDAKLDAAKQRFVEIYTPHLQ